MNTLSSSEVLLVEDNPGDVVLMQSALNLAGIIGELHVATDGELALQMLRGEAANGQYIQPRLILLDLNLPKKDGREVLMELKVDPLLKRIPVVVLSSSKSIEDIMACYDLYSSGYIVKPSSVDDLVNIVKSIFSYWGETSELPVKL